MHLGRVKNYIIIILVVANVISASLLAWKYYTAFTVNLQAEAELLALLGERGVMVSGLPAGNERKYVAERDIDAEWAAVEAVIGRCESVDVGGGIYMYEGEGGTAQFRSGGFEITLFTGGIYDGLESACRELILSMGLTNISDECVETPVEGGGTRLTFGQNDNKKPIFNARLTFEFSGGGQLKMVSGLWMFALTKPAEGDVCKSAGAVLLMFARDLDKQLNVESVQLGFRMKAAAPGISSLTPEWRILSSGGECYYLDAYTGQIITPEE